MKTALLALLLLAADGKPVPVQVGGRATADMRFGWPGTYFEGRFEGPQVTAEVETETDFFRLLVDGVEAARLGPGNTKVTVERLSLAPHVVRLEMVTENQSGSSRFLGFTTHGKPLPPPVRARRIEFIGDSHSVGYGNLSPTRDCDAQRVHDLTDTQLAFGPLVAKRLDADYRVIAYSGFGIVRNYNGGVAGDSLPKRYGRVIPGEPAPADDRGWNPDWIVIYLGTNDFSTPVHAGEAWTDAAALHADYRARYAEFLRMLAGKHPKARFLLIAHPDWFEDARAAANAARDVARVWMIETPAMELTGCNWHPSLRDQREISYDVETLIKSVERRDRQAKP